MSPLKLSFTRYPVAWLCSLHVLIWTWVYAAMRTNLDTPGDMVEAFIWGQSFEMGYFKHPPLAGWLSGLWFQVFPHTVLAYALLAALVSGLGLYGVASLAAHSQSGTSDNPNMASPTVIFVTLATALSAGFTIQASRYNCNAVALITWPWASLAFLKLMNYGRLRDALWFGFWCWAAVMGKYFAGILLISFFLASWLHPVWRARWRTGAPYIGLAVFLLLLTPHVIWLWSHPSPLRYAGDASALTAGQSLQHALAFVTAQWGFLLPGLVLLALAIGLRTALRVAFLAWMPSKALLGLWAISVFPVLLTALLTVATGARTASNWGLPMAGAVFVYLASWLQNQRPSGAGHFSLTTNTKRFVGGVWIFAMLAAPLSWALEAQKPTLAVATPYRELALTIDHYWLSKYPSPLSYIGGNTLVAANVAFYSHSNPRYWRPGILETPWINPKNLADLGTVIVCESQHAAECQSMATDPHWQTTTVSVRKQARGYTFPAHSYVLYSRAPAGQAEASPSSLERP